MTITIQQWSYLLIIQMFLQVNVQCLGQQSKTTATAQEEISILLYFTMFKIIIFYDLYHSAA